MKKVFFISLSVLLLLAGCTSELKDRVDDLEERMDKVEQVCAEMNSNISALQTIVDALQNKDYITSISEITKNGEIIGYTIIFSKSGEITIYNGEDGKDGYTPEIGIKKDYDGVYYWTLDGKWIVDENGDKIPAKGQNGKDGKDGENGTDGKDGKDGESIIPQLRIENGYWWVSYDNGENWEKLGPATNEDSGNSFFKDVVVHTDYVEFVMADNSVITIPLTAGNILSRLQSITYIPEYTDGKAGVSQNVGGHFDFKISPKDVVSDLVKNDTWKSSISMQAYYTKERTTTAVEFIDMPIIAFSADEANGMINIIASGKNLNQSFFDGSQNASAALVISDGNSSIMSDRIEMLPIADEWMPVDPVSEFADDFETITKSGLDYNENNWRFYSSDIQYGWKTGYFNKTTPPERSLEIKAYKAENTVTALAVLPPFDVKNAADKTLKFGLAYYYKDFDDSRIEIVASTDPIEDLSSSTWEVVQDCTFDKNQNKNTIIDFSVDINKYADSENVTFAFRYTGKGLTYRIYNVSFNKEVMPEFTLDGTFRPEAFTIDLDILCTTGNAAQAYVCPIPVYDLEGMLDEGMDLNMIMEEMAIPWGMALPLDETQLSQVNGDGLVYTLTEESGIQKYTDVACLVAILNPIQQMKVMRKDVYFGEYLTLLMEGIYDAEKQKVELSLNSPSQDAAKVYIAPIPVYDLEGMLEEGLDLNMIMEEMAIPWGMAKELTQEEVNKINDYGLTYSFGEDSGIQMYTDVAFIAAIYSAEGKMKTVRTDVYFGEHLTLTMEGIFNAETQKVDLTLKSPSQDAAQVYIAPIPVFDLEGMLEEGLDLNTIMQEMAIPWGMAVELTQDEVKKINDSGLAYSMGEETGMQIENDIAFIAAIFDADGNLKTIRKDIYFGIK